MSSDEGPRRWPLALIASPAAVAVWSGWVGLGTLCGFGIVHPLPGIASGFKLNTAITLPVGVEAYGAYALAAWVHPGTPERARTFARRSAIGALALGMTGQIVYHLLAATHSVKAPWPVVVLVSCMPVVTLGLGTALTHLIRHGTGTSPGRTDAPGTEPARTGGGPYPVPARARTGTLPGTGPGVASAARTGRPAVAGNGHRERPALPAGAGRDALVAELASEITAARADGREWRPDYEGLMARTGFRRSWCEKAVRAARDQAASAGPGAGQPVPGPRAGGGP